MTEQVSEQQSPLTIEPPFVFRERAATGAYHSFAGYTGWIPATVATTLLQITREDASALYVCLFGTLSIVLKKLLQADRITLGIPLMAGQTGREERIMVSVNVPDTSSLRQLLNSVNHALKTAYTSPAAHRPLSNVLLAYPEIHAGVQTADDDLRIDICREADKISLHFHYDQQAFTGYFIAQLFRQWVQVLSYAGQLDCMVKNMTLLDVAQREMIVHGFNRTARERHENQTVISLFEKYVSATPDAIALAYGDTMLTYEELNREVNKLAGYLKTHYHPGAEEIVALMVPPSDKWVVAMLAILKAGAVYLPLDTALPAKRKAWILADAGVKLLLTDIDQLAEQPDYQGEIFLLDNGQHHLPETREEPVTAILPGSLAYVIYTSGTTGTPKGVMLEHGGLLNMIQCQIRQFDIRASDKVLQFASLSFDAAVSEMFMALCAGARLVMADRPALKDAQLFSALLQQQQITVVTLPPSYLGALPWDTFLSLRVIISAGEKLHTAAARYLSRHLSFYNAYGPTECTVCTTIHLIQPDMDDEEMESIGTPIDNVQVYILGVHQEVLPVGVPGDIYIGGSGLARGYLHQPALTAERFITTPWPDVPGERLYYTGDTGKWLANGKIVYTGRRDDQIKVRGYRIEPAEVAAVVMASGLVQQCEVMAVAQAGGQLQLTAFVVPGAVFDQEKLTSYVAERLPGYMVPAVWRSLAALPVTHNGKADRKKLQEMAPLPEEETCVVAASNAIEGKLADIWKEVLELEHVSVTSDFFQSGGDSLQAIRLLAIIREHFTADITINDLFQYTSIRQLADYIRISGGDGNAMQATPASYLPPLLPAAESRTGALPLSFGQERLWLIHQLTGSAHYHLPVMLRLKGTTDTVCLEKAIRAIADRHEILRTVYLENDGEVRQVIMPPGKWQFDFCGELPAEQDLSGYIQAFSSRAFTLTTDHMLRAAMIITGTDERLLIIVLHHIAADGWSVPILVREFMENYRLLKDGGAITLPPLPVQYADYAIWQRKQEGQAYLVRQLAYWEKKLDGITPVMLPVDYPRAPVAQHAGKALYFHFDIGLKHQLEQLSHEEGVTLFMTLLAVFNVLLYRYSGQEDLCTGTAVAGRQQRAAEQLVGFFINMLVIRIRLSGAGSFREVLAQVKQNTLEAFDHQDIPFELVADRLTKVRDDSRHPLFQAAFILQNQPEAPAIVLDGLEVKPEEPASATSRFDLGFEATATDTVFKLRVEYNTALFEEDTVHRLAAHYGQLLKAVVASPEQQVGHLNMLRDADCHQLLNGFNDTAHVFPADRILPVLFEEQAAARPEAVALIYNSIEYTFRALDVAANRLATCLRTRYGVNRGSLVGVQLPRNEWQIIALLAVLKAGAAYVPLDPASPASRVQEIADDCHWPLLISEEWLAAYQPEASQYSDAPLPCQGTPEDLMYVIFTSGSTGKPKGVMMPYYGVMNRLWWMWEHYGFSREDVILQKTNFTFDVSVWEIFMPLCMGARMVLCSQEEVLSPDRLQALIVAHRVSCLHFVPGMLDVFIDALPATGMPAGMDGLRLVFASGEALRPETVQRWYRHTAVTLHNLYGPTEAAVDVTYYETGAADTRIPIGRPIWNTAIRVLNTEGGLVPPGGTGEICIAGAGLARGYLNNPELTALRFVPDPFVPGNKIYRTGDYGRWLPDGQLEYLGRKDGQVKIRGFRIETGEIEAAINSLPYVTTCAVVALPDTGGQMELVAYLVSHQEPDITSLRRDLAVILPAYMLPARYVRLSEMPLTTSGKTDKKRLPALAGQQLAGGGDYVPPSGDTEQQLVKIWQTLLGDVPISTTQPFFELGGNSIKLMKMVAMIRKQFHKDLPVVKAFGLPAIRDLAQYLEQTGEEQQPSTADAPDASVDIMKNSLLLINKFTDEA